MVKIRKHSKKSKLLMSLSRKQGIKEGRIKIWNKGLTKETDERIRLYAIKGSETKKKRQTSKKLWQNKEYRDKVIKASLKGLLKRPTSLEKRFIHLIRVHRLPYRYVGDGSFLIGYKNPDFINTNGEKICIEVANRIHHQGDWKQKRIEHFKKWGWRCIVVFEDEVERFFNDP